MSRLRQPERGIFYPLRCLFRPGLPMVIGTHRKSAAGKPWPRELPDPDQKEIDHAFAQSV